MSPTKTSPAIHPTHVTAPRLRFIAAGGTTVCFDSFVLAELACNRQSDSGYWCPTADPSKVLRAFRARQDLVQTGMALANDLRAELGYFKLGEMEVFAEIDSP
jgi:hypothetical protein